MKVNKAKMRKQPAMFQREFKDGGQTIVHQITPCTFDFTIGRCEMRCGTRNGMGRIGELQIDTLGDIEYSTVGFNGFVRVTRTGMLEWSRTLGEYFKTICNE